jgi:hypothetical protein
LTAYFTGKKIFGKMIVNIIRCGGTLHVGLQFPPKKEDDEDGKGFEHNYRYPFVRRV